jgi:hypothetical protein
LQRDVLTRTVDDEVHRQPGIQKRRLLHVLEVKNRLSVDRLDDVAQLEARIGRGGIGLYKTDAGDVLGAAEDHEKTGEHDERQHKVGGRARGDDRRSVQQRLSR